MYVYETLNLINGKKYIGVSITENKSDNYLGSGVLLKQAIKKYGKKNFKKTIIKIFNNEKEAREYERLIIEKLNAIDSDDYYNLVVGGYGGGVKKHSVNEETRKKISDSHKGKKLSREQVINMAKPTLQYDLDGSFIKEYETKADAEKIIGCSMTKLVGDKTVYIKGYLWKYKNNFIELTIEPYIKIKEKHKKSASIKSAKLSEKKIINLIKDRELGYTYKKLSMKYKISVSCVCEIINGKTYKWVKNEKL